MTKADAVRLLDAWSAQPLIRRLMPGIVTAVRLVIGKPKVTVGLSRLKRLRWRERD